MREPICRKHLCKAFLDIKQSGSGCPILFQFGRETTSPSMMTINTSATIKSTKLEMKLEKSQQTTQKYKGSKETTIRNCMPIKWTTWKKWTNS